MTLDLSDPLLEGQELQVGFENTSNDMTTLGFITIMFQLLIVLITVAVIL